MKNIHIYRKPKHEPLTIKRFEILTKPPSERKRNLDGDELRKRPCWQSLWTVREPMELAQVTDLKTYREEIIKEKEKSERSKNPYIKTLAKHTDGDVNLIIMENHHHHVLLRRRKRDVSIPSQKPFCSAYIKLNSESEEEERSSKSNDRYLIIETNQNIPVERLTSPGEKENIHGDHKATTRTSHVIQENCHTARLDSPRHSKGHKTPRARSSKGNSEKLLTSSHNYSLSLEVVKTPRNKSSTENNLRKVFQNS